MGVIVLRGNCPTNRGNCPWGNCPTGVMVLGGSCPGGNCPRGSCPMGVVVLRGSCPWGSCPQGSCPRGSRPRGSCPVTCNIAVSQKRQATWGPTINSHTLPQVTPHQGRIQRGGGGGVRTPKLHKEGKNVACVHAKGPHFST